MSRQLYRCGSVADIKCSLLHSPLETIAECEEELKLEQSHQNRSTVIKSIEVQKRAIERKKGGQNV